METIELTKEDLRIFRSELKSDLKEIFATKIDLKEQTNEFKQEMSAMRLEFKQEMNAMRLEFKQEMNAMRLENREIKLDLVDRVHKAKIATIVWMISLFVSQTATLLGFLYFMLSK